MILAKTQSDGLKQYLKEQGALTIAWQLIVLD